MFKWKLDNTQGSIKNGQSRESGNIGYPRRRKDRNWQHRVHKTKIKKNTRQYVLDTTIRKQTQIT